MSDRYYEREFRASLIQDMEESNTVKLDMRKAPWELIGEVTKVQDTIFEIRTDAGTVKRNISDILHYRLA